MGDGRPINVTLVSPCKIKTWKKSSANIDFWLNEMAALCQEALLWDKECPDKEVEILVAKLRYIFVHVAPLAEQNEIVGEWLELAIYIAIGFDNVRHSDERYGIYDAQTQTFTDFRTKYRSTIKLGENRYRKQEASPSSS